jgi:hypothetical protein
VSSTRAYVAALSKMAAFLEQKRVQGSAETNGAAAAAAASEQGAARAAHRA